jgi:flagellar basal-body rod modification protein FlgD
METGSITNALAPNTTPAKNNDALRDLDMDQFLKLMITELQNQDPLNPLENAEILQQISQIREIGATSRLTETLDAVLLGQNLTSASSMIGKTVEALSDDAKNVRGVVDKVTVTGGEPRLHIGGKAVRLKNVKEIVSQADLPAAGEPATTAPSNNTAGNSNQTNGSTTQPPAESS